MTFPPEVLWRLVSRWAAAWTLVVVLAGVLLVAGAGQMFLETTMAGLALFLRGASWGGLAACAFLLGPLAWGRRRGRLFTLALALVHLAAFAFVSVWDSWLGPVGGLG